MNTDFFLQIVSFLIVFISFLLAFFLFTVKSKNKIGNIFLALYLIIRAVDVSSYFYYNFINLPIELELLRMDIGSFLEFPFLYLFVLSIVYSDFKVKKLYLLHLIPFVIVTLVQIPVFYLADFEMQNKFADTYLSNSYGIFSVALAHFQNLLYIVLIFILLRRYRRILLGNYSISDDYNYRWLMQLVVFLSVVFVIAIVKNIQKYDNTKDDLLPYRLAVSIAMLLFTCWLVLKALYAPKIFTGINSRLQLSENKKTNAEKEKPKLLEQMLKLKRTMLESKPFLNPDFTIQELSKLTQIDTRSISTMLNHRLNQNFYEFVNFYRIEEAKNILVENKTITILEVLYGVGYNSKSTFNTHFKKATGLTPTAYRNKYTV